MYITLSDRPTTSRRAPDGRRRRVPPIVITLGFVSLVTDISSESVAAILPLYLTASLGLSAISYGFIDALYQGVSALVRIGGGWAADRGGHPKWVALLGYGLSAVARFFLLFSTGLAAISAVISADRIGKGLRTAPRDAMISAAAPADSLGYAFGVHRALDTAGAAIGPVIAFVVLWWIPDGYLTVMVISLGFAVLGVALLGLLVPDRPSAEQRPARPSIRWRDVATPGLVRLLVVAGALGLLTVGDGFIYLALLDRGGFAAHWFPLLYVGTNIAYLSLAIPIGRLADRVGRAKVLIWGHGALIAAYAAVAFSWNIAASTVIALLLLGTFYAATDGVIAALAGRLVPPEVRASGIASAQTVVALARMASSAGFGVLWFLFGPQVALVVVALVLLVALPFALSAVRRLDLRSGAAA
ncbi:MFS transporter [Nocardioides endophyticus]|uniref:MFS transporter n=1 Tax=Nocardioides endophyticus TaxID=1353775 RepID=A0ABP8ZDQ0_9ACTN